MLTKAPTVACYSQKSGEVGEGRNWIERSFPVTGEDAVSPKTVIDYNVRIDGESFQTGSLSKRMYETILERSSLNTNNPEIQRALKIYAMDFTAKEAVRAALESNGLVMVLSEDEQDEGMWADIDSIQFLQDSRIFDSWEEVVDEWVPGHSFSFIARQVPAKMRELTLDELLQALDPNGELRKEAKDEGRILLDEGLISLAHVANENVRRTQAAPMATDKIYTGTNKRGYQPIHADALSIDQQEDGTEKRSTMMHVMDALVSHGCLLVDITNGGKSWEAARTMNRMWEATNELLEAKELSTIPAMQTAKGSGSKFAKVGFSSNHGMTFLETRWNRDGNILPSEVEGIIGPEGVQALRDAFDCISRLGKDVTRIAVAASSIEVGLLSPKMASEKASLLADELLDDRIPLKADIVHLEESVCMSPQRLCSYTNINSDTPIKEIFGAHTDSSFVTAVPVSCVAGLEVFDEAEGVWYRPELAAKKFWSHQPTTQNKSEGVVDPGEELPWNVRYVVLMPGELLQLATRNEILASVHRVLASSDGPTRVSAPVLLRGRSGVTFDVSRYLGSSFSDPLLEQCDGMTIEQIHDSMQPGSFQ